MSKKKIEEQDISEDVVWKAGCIINGVPIDPGNSSFYIKGYREHGKSLRADYFLRRDKDGHVIEDAKTYWSRVIREISQKTD